MPLPRDPQYPEADVRQSAFAMVGDLANKAVKSLYPILDQLLPIIIDSINPNPRVATSGMESNVIWCTGELAMALGGERHHWRNAILTKEGNDPDGRFPTICSRPTHRAIRPKSARQDASHHALRQSVCLTPRKHGSDDRAPSPRRTWRRGTSPGRHPEVMESDDDARVAGRRTGQCASRYLYRPRE